MISPPRSHQFRVAGSPGYSLPVFRGGAHPVWGLTAIITLQVSHPYYRLLSPVNQEFVCLFLEKNGFSSVFASPSSWHCLSASTPLPVTAQVMTGIRFAAVKLFCCAMQNIQRGNFSLQFQSQSSVRSGQDGGGEQQLALRGDHRLLPHPHNPGLESAPCPGQ